MLRLIGIVVSIGLADSLNPSTLAPAMYFATGRRARERVTEFTIAVFTVYFLGGAAIAAGFGQLVHSFLPHTHHRLTYLIEICVGVSMVAAAVMLWGYREALSARDPPDFDPHGRSSWVLGATITAVELPTAFPYFAAIAAIVGSGLGPVRNLVLLVLFNICFVLPLLAIIGTLWFAGEQADRVLARGRSLLQRHWPTLLAGLALLAGLFVILLGTTGLAALHDGRLHGFFGRLHRSLHP